MRIESDGTLGAFAEDKISFAPIVGISSGYPDYLTVSLGGGILAPFTVHEFITPIIYESTNFSIEPGDLRFGFTTGLHLELMGFIGARIGVGLNNSMINYKSEWNREIELLLRFLPLYVKFEIQDNTAPKLGNVFDYMKLNVGLGFI